MTLTHAASTPASPTTEPATRPTPNRNAGAAWLGFAATLALACGSFAYLEAEAIAAAPSEPAARHACLQIPAAFK